MHGNRGKDNYEMKHILSTLTLCAMFLSVTPQVLHADAISGYMRCEVRFSSVLVSNEGNPQPYGYLSGGMKQGDSVAFFYELQSTSEGFKWDFQVDDKVISKTIATDLSGPNGTFTANEDGSYFQFSFDNITFSDTDKNISLNRYSTNKWEMMIADVNWGKTMQVETYVLDCTNSRDQIRPIIQKLFND